MKNYITILSLILALSFTISAQVRPVEEPEDTQKTEEAESKVEEKTEDEKTPLKKLPKSLTVKYMGGLIGFRKKQEGTVKFDVVNERLVFFGKDEKEKFSVPYGAMIAVDPSPKKVQSGTGRVVNAVPYFGILGNFMKKKKNYMVIHFEDPDIGVKGNLNFLLDTTTLLKQAIDTVGQNAEMTKRGEAYVRRKGF